MLRTLIKSAALAVVIAGAGAWWLRLRINLSPSLPVGLYRIVDDGAHAEPGDLVLACPPPAFAVLARERHYLLPGPCPGGTMPLGKLILAAAGDRLQLAPERLTLNGRALPWTATAAADADGHPLPRLPAGSRRVATGEIWLAAPHPRSLDSRYFGPVVRSQLRGRLAAVAVLGGGEPQALAREIRRAHAPLEERN